MNTYNNHNMCKHKHELCAPKNRPVARQRRSNTLRRAQAVKSMAVLIFQVSGILEVMFVRLVNLENRKI